MIRRSSGHHLATSLARATPDTCADVQAQRKARAVPTVQECEAGGGVPSALADCPLPSHPPAIRREAGKLGYPGRHPPCRKGPQVRAHVHLLWHLHGLRGPGCRQMSPRGRCDENGPVGTGSLAQVTQVLSAQLEDASCAPTEHSWLEMRGHAARWQPLPPLASQAPHFSFLALSTSFLALSTSSRKSLSQSNKPLRVQ